MNKNKIIPKLMPNNSHFLLLIDKWFFNFNSIIEPSIYIKNIIYDQKYLNSYNYLNRI
jgi:hypothetical protein